MTTFAILLLVRVAVLLLAAAATVTILRRASAAIRASVWAAVFIGLVSLPAMARLVPAWRLPILPAQQSVAAPVVVAGTPVASGEMPLRIELRQSSDDDHSREAATAPSSVEAADVQTPAARIAADRPPTPAAAPPFLTPSVLFLIGWAAIAVMLIARVAAARVRLARQIGSMRSAATIAQRARWQACVDEACRDMRLRRHVAVQITDVVSVPAIAGLVKPTILLPPDAVDWPDEMRRVVAIHELAHLTRRDGVWQLASQLACAMYWFVPAVWLGARHASRLREEATDDVVLRSGVPAPTYAASLIEIARRCTDIGWAQPSLAMASPQHMERRVAAILDARTKHGRLTAGMALVLAALAVGTVGMVAAASPVSRQRQLPPVPPVPPAPPVAPTPPAMPAPSATATPAAPAPPAAASALPVPAPSVAPLAPIPPSAPSAPLAVPAPPAPVQSVSPPVVAAAPVPPPAPPAPAPIAPIAPQTASSQTASSSHSEVHTGTASTFCGPATTSFSNSVNENDRGRTWKLKTAAPGCEIDLRQEGKVEFNDDFTDVKSLSAGGVFELSVLKGGVRRDLSLANRNGSLERTWKVDGRERPFDDEARRWFAAFLLDLDRQTAIGVDSRLPELLRRVCVYAVFKETALMPNDYARGIYYKKLAAATTLSAANLAAILDQATSLHTGDYYASELLKNLALPQVRDAGVHAAALRLLGTVNSDYYLAEGVHAIVVGPQKGSGRPLASGDIDLAVRATARMKSDYYRAEVMKGLLGTGRLEPRTRRDLARLIADMHEDYYIGDVIGQLARNGSLDADTRRTLIEASAKIRSDYYRAESLKTLLGDAEVRESDLMDITAAAATITSDHYKADVLTTIARHAAATARVREAVTSAAESMSQYYRDSVKRAANR